MAEEVRRRGRILRFGYRGVLGLGFVGFRVLGFGVQGLGFRGFRKLWAEVLYKGLSLSGLQDSRGAAAVCHGWFTWVALGFKYDFTSCRKRDPNTAPQRNLASQSDSSFKDKVSWTRGLLRAPRLNLAEAKKHPAK